MPDYTAPGVHVDKEFSSQTDLRAVATAVAAFVGRTASAPHDDPSDPEGTRPRLVTNWAQFEQLYGGFENGCVLPLSVFGYFENGGTEAYIVRIPDLGPTGVFSKPHLPASDRSLGTPVSATKPEREADLHVSLHAGIDSLANAGDVTIVAVPDLVTVATQQDGSVNLDLWKSVQDSLIAHCEQQANRVTILDPPPGRTVSEVKEWRSHVAMYDSAFATMYYPWIRIQNPVGTESDRSVLVPPSGHVAGVWARNDETRGVWKAPTNDTIRGCLDLERPISSAEQDLLNPIGVNCIRPFGTRGIRIWGARTLSSDVDERYLNVRRLINMIEMSILEGILPAVLESNDVQLREDVSRTLTRFLTGLWRSGALFGESADLAFFVKCDEENNPSRSIDEGRLVVEVGIAPVKPAEFVLLRISQQRPLSEGT